MIDYITNRKNEFVAIRQEDTGRETTLNLIYLKIVLIHKQCKKGMKTCSQSCDVCNVNLTRIITG